MTYNKELIEQLGFSELESVDLNKINAEVTIQNEKSGVIILFDGIVVHDIYNRNVFNLKKQLQLANIYITSKEEFDKAKQYLMEKDFDKLDVGLTFDSKEGGIIKHSCN